MAIAVWVVFFETSGVQNAKFPSRSTVPLEPVTTSADFEGRVAGR